MPPPLLPELQLHLAHEAIPLWEKTEEELEQIGLPPPFWAFAWAGGQALARYVLDNPHLASGRDVLDFAAGSGLVGIAAARCGAARVTASDIDPFAESAMALNAAANDVVLEAVCDDLIGRNDGWSLVLAGDIFYEAPTAKRVITWFEDLAAGGATVLIGDPGRTYLPRERLTECALYEVPVSRALEDREIKRTRVWRL
ncbi:MAG TPA: methyltransferase [Afifellaceae bacterium]|nr:methyltransferase [Afifellaceae bacterium]